MLNTDLISLSGQLYCGCFHEQNDLKKLRNWFGDGTEQLKRLELGDFIRYCDGETVKMRIDKFAKNVETVNIQPITPKPKPIEPLPTLQPKADYGILAKVAIIGFLGLLFLIGAM